jgi:hypothetical protein
MLIIDVTMRVVHVCIGYGSCVGRAQQQVTDINVFSALRIQQTIPDSGCAVSRYTSKPEDVQLAAGSLFCTRRWEQLLLARDSPIEPDRLYCA